MSWWNARQNCIDLGGYLATPEDATENVQFLTRATGIWLGLSDVAVEGAWVTSKLAVPGVKMNF